MRTTLDIDDHPLRRAKQLAAREGTTLTRIVEEACEPDASAYTNLHSRSSTYTGR